MPGRPVVPHRFPVQDELMHSDAGTADYFLFAAMPSLWSLHFGRSNLQKFFKWSVTYSLCTV